MLSDLGATDNDDAYFIDYLEMTPGIYEAALGWSPKPDTGLTMTDVTIVGLKIDCSWAAVVYSSVFDKRQSLSNGDDDAIRLRVNPELDDENCTGNATLFLVETTSWATTTKRT